jgi:hypothetical protein
MDGLIAMVDMISMSELECHKMNTNGVVPAAASLV